MSLIKIYTRAEDLENFNKYFQKYFEILNKISNKEQIFYLNRMMKLNYEIVLISSYSNNGGPFEKGINDYMDYISALWSHLHHPENTGPKIS